MFLLRLDPLDNDIFKSMYGGRTEKENVRINNIDKVKKYNKNNSFADLVYVCIHWVHWAQELTL